MAEIEGRWEIFVCTGCGGATGRHAECDALRERTPVVPCDDAAVERAARAVVDNYSYDDDDPNWARDLAEAVLRAAGGQDGC